MHIYLYATNLQAACKARIIDVTINKPLPSSTALVNYRVELPDGSTRHALRSEFTYIAPLVQIHRKFHAPWCYEAA